MAISRFYPKTLLQVGLELAHDVRVDLASNTIKLPHHLVWVAGLPKSGTTRIERVFQHLPYVDASSSLVRKRYLSDREHDHDLPVRFIRKYASARRFTFIKTHSHLNRQTLREALSQDVAVLVSSRDLRDMMISRYFHVLADPRHWQRPFIAKLPFLEGFRASLTVRRQDDPDTPIDYYYKWIRDWRLAVQQEERILWLQYEEFNLDPVTMIESILCHLGLQTKVSGVSIAKMLKQEFVQGLKADLSTNLGRSSRQMSTVREGKHGGWKTFLDVEELAYFESLLPGPSNDVYWGWK